MHMYIFGQKNNCIFHKMWPSVLQPTLTERLPCQKYKNRAYDVSFYSQTHENDKLVVIANHGDKHLAPASLNLKPAQEWQYKWL